MAPLPLRECAVLENDGNTWSLHIDKAMRMHAGIWA